MVQQMVEHSHVAPSSRRLQLTAPSSHPPAMRGAPFSSPHAAPGRDSYMALQGLVRADELSVVFQPIVRMGDGALFAYEALVRCTRADVASPPVLFERAVSAGCVGRLGRMVREIAVPLASGIPLFLNVHPLELEEAWLVRPDDPIYAHDSDVYLEVTESVPLTHFELCHHVLHEVRVRGGVHLVVDDLGAGYSNLKRIVDLEPRVVKLDRELIVGIDRSTRQQRLVANVVRLCVDLNATVVAEGIETADEYDALCETGVHYGQGFLFARPQFPLPPVTWPPAPPSGG